MMKYLILLACISFCSDAGAQATGKLISFDGIGIFKPGMSQAGLEKALAARIILTNPTDTVSGSWVDSSTIRYQNNEYKLRWYRHYTDNNNFEMWLSSVEISNPQFRTNRGIGVGSTRDAIINAYDDHHITVFPDYTDETYTTVSKTNSNVTVKNHDFSMIMIFKMVNKKVTKVQVSTFFTDEE